MKRSSAPSNLLKSKKPRFITPWANNGIQPPAVVPSVQSAVQSVVQSVHSSAVQSVVQSVHSSAVQSVVPSVHSSAVQSVVPSVHSSAVQSVVPSVHSSNSSTIKPQYYNVIWGKLSMKKHKTWEGDGILSVTNGNHVTLMNMSGQIMSQSKGHKVAQLVSLCEGSKLTIGGKEIEIVNVMGEDEIHSCFDYHKEPPSSDPPKVILQATKKFQNPLKEKNKLCPVNIKKKCVPLYDTLSPDSLILTRPNQNHQLLYNVGGLPVVDVVVDPRLVKHLRPHQREGVVFLYECVMNMREFNGSGAILGDEMGLGKSLQCIALIWTLLRQGPYGGRPVIKRVAIITPGSLVKNWLNECNKWLGGERLKIFAASSTDNRPQDFVRSPIYPVLIISYELFIKHYSSLSSVHFDMIICDEGHRLKNINIKTFTTLSSIPTKKRIVLTGTPIQNDLTEFYALIEFCNPGILGSQATFRNVYEQPIAQSYQSNATQEEVTIGKQRLQELMKLSNLFYLRRTQEINNKYLPNKIENIIYCNPTPLQVSIYQNMSHLFLSDSTDPLCHLLYINALKKLCNCPSLLYQSSGDITGSNMSSILTDIKRCYPEDYQPDECCVENSGKLWVLSAMLECLRANNSREKIVIVSNYTKTLNVLEKLCQRFEYSFLRLDGATPVTTRQKIVDSFNSKYNNAFAFLLSSKAGGVGLNLIGASRLILYDIDWNPANDLQAMARVWRDGQVNTVHIYRLLTTGTIEEKIFQRQIAKQGLSDAVDTRDGGSGAGAIHFTKEELKDLFSLDVSTQSITHDQLNCQCLHRQKSNSLEELSEERITNVDDIRVASLNNQPIRTELKNSTINKLNEWDHIPPPFDAMKDQLILHAANNISFVMVNESNT